MPSSVCASSPSRSGRIPIPSSSNSTSRLSANSPAREPPRWRTLSAFSFILSTFVRNGNGSVVFAPMHRRKRARPCRSAGHSASYTASKFPPLISNECLRLCTSSRSLRRIPRKRSAAASSITSCASGERSRRGMGIWMQPQSGLLILGLKLCGSPMRFVRPRLHLKSRARTRASTWSEPFTTWQEVFGRNSATSFIVMIPTCPNRSPS